jgi:GMC oxidoreductase
MATNGTSTNGAHAPDALVNSAEEFLKSEYDFVICGGGTAGLVLAARLTEDPNISVGVLEAGENKLNDVFVDTPAMFTQMFGKDEYDWKFMTVPQVGLHAILEVYEIDLGVESEQR